MGLKLTILVVDDSRIIVERLISLITDLKETGKILYAFDYDEGISALEFNNIDLIILDINLPEKSGIDVLKYLKRKKYPCTKIIFTENASESKRKICMSLGADYFLNKFEDFDTIPDIIQKIAE